MKLKLTSEHTRVKIGPEVKVISMRIDKKFCKFFGDTVEILGLGNDNNMYYWSFTDKTWYGYWDERMNQISQT